MTGSGPYPYTQESQDMLDSTNSEPDLMNIIITVDESSVYRYDPEPVILFKMKNLMRALNTTSLKCCLPSTDAIDRWEKNSRMRMKVQGRLIEIHQVFPKNRIIF